MAYFSWDAENCILAPDCIKNQEVRWKRNYFSLQLCSSFHAWRASGFRLSSERYNVLEKKLLCSMLNLQLCRSNFTAVLVSCFSHHFTKQHTQPRIAFSCYLLGISDSAIFLSFCVMGCPGVAWEQALFWQTHPLRCHQMVLEPSPALPPEPAGSSGLEAPPWTWPDLP